MAHEEPEIPNDNDKKRDESGGPFVMLGFAGAIIVLIVLLYFAY